MASEIHVIGSSGATGYVNILNSTGQRWNGTTFEDFAVENYNDYVLYVTEDGSTGIFRGDFPSSCPSGAYDVVLFMQLGDIPADGDRPVNAQSISWGGVEGVVEGSIPLGTFSAEQMKDYIIRSGLLRTDMDDEIYDALTDVVMEMEQRFDYSERQLDMNSTDYITYEGDYKLNLETNHGNIVSVVLIDGNYSSKLIRIQKPTYDLFYPNPIVETSRGYPKHFSLYAGQIYLGPAPSEISYAYRLSYSKRLTSVIDVNVTDVPFSSKFREVLKDGVLARLFNNLKNYAASDRYYLLYQNGIARAEKSERDDRGGSHCNLYSDY